MKSILVKPASCLKGKIQLLGDKSIAHRYLILSSISQGKTRIKNFPINRDCLFTLNAFKKLGVKIIRGPQRKGISEITVFGAGLYGLVKPRVPLFVGDSGTTLRLILGILAGQDFKVKLTTGKSLSKRPMLRLTRPLRLMGAKICVRQKRITSPLTPNTKHLISNTRLEEYPPITISGGHLSPIHYRMPIASAQVKSAILFAGLYVRGITEVIEPIRSRDHSERLLKIFGAGIKVQGNKIVIKGDQELVSPGIVVVPGDISSASFFIVAALILPDSRLVIKDVSLNPSRLGILRVLKRMGANIQISQQKARFDMDEPMGDLRVKSSHLKGVTVESNEIPVLIDELPILMVTACWAKGKTVIKGVGELRFKETDRIASMSENLRKMGAAIEILRSGSSEDIVIHGINELKAGHLRSFGDHRTAMSLMVCGLKAKGTTQIDDISCIAKSFPQFPALLKSLVK